MSISFKNTPNPDPTKTEEVTWEVNGGTSGKTIQWSIKKPNAIIDSLNEQDTLCVLKPTGARGWANVSVHLPGEGSPITRSIAVGQLLAYNAHHTLGQAPTHLWKVVESQPGGVPSFKDISHYGMAYDAHTKSLVLNYEYLDKLHKRVSSSKTEPTYFHASSPSHGESGSKAAIDAYYAYGPDGTLWKLETQWDKITDAPSNIPPPDQMKHALAWVPETNNTAGRSVDSEAVDSEYVMCFLLNQTELDFTPDTTTFYTFTPA